MTATLKFDQVGKPDVGENRSREDITPGQAVQITNVNPGAVNVLELLWKPPEDDTAAIAGADPNYTIVPKPGTDGTYLFRLNVDGDTLELSFTTVTALFGLPIPAANEKADPTASLVKNTETEIRRSSRNKPFGPFSSGSAFAWWPVIERWFRKLESLFDPTTGHAHTGAGDNGPKISFPDLSDIPANFSRGEFFTYTDTANKVAGPLATPPVINELLLWIIGGIAQDYGIDYTVRQVVSGSAPGYYVCLSSSSTAPGGGTFLSGANPSAGIDGQLLSGDKLVLSYPTFPAP